MLFHCVVEVVNCVNVHLGQFSFCIVTVVNMRFDPVIIERRVWIAMKRVRHDIHGDDEILCHIAIIHTQI